MEPTLEEIFGSYMPYKITDDTWVLSFMNGSEYMYLLEGNAKALLIDTGYGVGNLKKCVEKLRITLLILKAKSSVCAFPPCFS